LRNAQVTVCENAAGQVLILYKSKPFHSLKILRNREFLVSSDNEHRPNLNN
jgi:hypothetical protein